MGNECSPEFTGESQYLNGVNYLWACTDNPNGFGHGSTAMFNVTQKFWVGSPIGTRFQGACVELGILTLYTDHGTLSQYETPITNLADCAQGHTIN
jgi:hypothetical protein